VNEADVKNYAAQFDSISVCLSKGLGAPVGSLLLGKSGFIHKARRVRKVMGGGMRQAGFLAAAGLFALKNNVERLDADHGKARLLEKELMACSWVETVIPVDTNIVVIVLKSSADREKYIELFAAEQIRIAAFGPGMLRMVTHLDCSDEQIGHVIGVIRKL
jgi:threonine aldolase